MKYLPKHRQHLEAKQRHNILGGHADTKNPEICQGNEDDCCTTTALKDLINR